MSNKSLEKEISEVIARHEASNKEQEKAKRKAPSLWVWEFSKKLVIIVTLIYITEQIYSAVVMWRSGDFSFLGTMMEQSSDILKTCVFGYLVKSGVENAFKINNSSSRPKSDHSGAVG